MRVLKVMASEHSLPGMWIRAFWGFGPWEDGYVGWTRESDRDRILAEANAGDLILIYGASSAETDRDDRKQVLGVLQIDLKPIMDRDKSSAVGLQRKIDNGWAHRWTFAVPVRRAWRIDRRIELRHLAPITYTPNQARVIASQGAKLTDEEVETVLQLPVTEVDVFGEPPVGVGGANPATLKSIFAPSRGLSPSFGTRTSEYEDREHWLYMAKFDGNIAALLNRPSVELVNKSLVKVGYSNAPDRRLAELNAGLPPACLKRWSIWLQSAVYPNGASAKLAEDKLKAIFASEFESLGGEFYVGDKGRMPAKFSTAPAVASFTIRA